MGIHKSFFYYESTKDDSEVEAAIRQKAEATNDGFWKIFRLIRKDGHPWNHKKVHRVYEQAKAVAQTLASPCQESARDTGPRKYHLVDGLRY